MGYKKSEKGSKLHQKLKIMLYSYSLKTEISLKAIIS